MDASEQQSTRSPARPGGMARPGAHAVVGEIQAGKLTARQAVENSLEMIERHNSTVNAVIVLDAGAARQRADELDINRANGRSNGSLDGLPMTIKETFDLESKPTSWGKPEYRDSIAQQDSTVASRLQAAGAIILGKTNLPEGMQDWETANPVYGATRNPWDLSRSAGGSSGGSAAAVASGMVSADVGSDMGGSIRIPAHYCGVCGIKPTWNIIPLCGHSLQKDVRSADINVAGPITRDPGDLALLLSALAGPGEFEAEGWTLRLPEPDEKPLNGFRLAAFLDHPACPVDQSYIEVMKRFLEDLKRSNVAVEETTPQKVDFVRATDMMNILVRSETSTRMSEEEFADTQSVVNAVDTSQSEHQSRNARGASLSHRDWLLLHEERQRLRFAWEKFFDRFDAFLCPVASTAAPPLKPGRQILERTIEVNGQEIPMLDQHFWAAIASLPYLPSVVLPIGITEHGLPVGIQIVGRSYSDLQMISLAGLIRSQVVPCSGNT